MSEPTQEAEREKALKEVAEVNARDKDKVAEVAEKKAQSLEKARLLAEKRSAEVEMKLGKPSSSLQKWKA